MNIGVVYWFVIRLVLILAVAPLGLYFGGYLATYAGTIAWLPDTEFLIQFTVFVAIVSLLSMIKPSWRKPALFVLFSLAAMFVFRMHIGNTYEIFGVTYAAAMIQVWAISIIGLLHFLRPNKVTQPLLVLLPISAVGYFLYFSILKNMELTFELAKNYALMESGEISATTFQQMLEGVPDYYLSSLISGLYGFLLVFVYYAANWPKYVP